jgi:hypothetical protein
MFGCRVDRGGGFGENEEQRAVAHQAAGKTDSFAIARPDKSAPAA